MPDQSTRSAPDDARRVETAPLTLDDFATFAENAADILDDDVMQGAWPNLPANPWSV